MMDGKTYKGKQNQNNRSNEKLTPLYTYCICEYPVPRSNQLCIPLAGPVVWYQKFEYAVGHWLHKTAEHVFGCVLCSPGCFSLFRAEALMDDNVMKKYTVMSSKAQHYIQYDQGTSPERPAGFLISHQLRMEVTKPSGCGGKRWKI